VAAVLVLSRSLAEEMVAHCLRQHPLEACGLLGGDAEAERVDDLYLADNLAASAMLYTLDPKAHLRADRAAEATGTTLLGVFHSHTHSEAYPSPTDVGQAPDPTWHYVIVSLRDTSPAIRSFRIVDGEVAEERLELR
jgi:proteasome lid subunit RPN8/RPN11